MLLCEQKLQSIKNKNRLCTIEDKQPSSETPIVSNRNTKHMLLNFLFFFNSCPVAHCLPEDEGAARAAWEKATASCHVLSHSALFCIWKRTIRLPGNIRKRQSKTKTTGHHEQGSCNKHVKYRHHRAARNLKSHSHNT